MMKQYLRLKAEAPGALLMTSNKADVYAAPVGSRGKVGQTFLFDTQGVAQAERGVWVDLVAQAETLDQRLITFEILALQVIQQLAALVDHADQTTTRVVILLVAFEVVLQAIDVGA